MDRTIDIKGIPLSGSCPVQCETVNRSGAMSGALLESIERDTDCLDEVLGREVSLAGVVTEVYSKKRLEAVLPFLLAVNCMLVQQLVECTIYPKDTVKHVKRGDAVKFEGRVVSVGQGIFEWGYSQIKLKAEVEADTVEVFQTGN